MYKLRRALFSQNFLHNHKLVSSLVGRSSVGKHDLVLEIGSGKGIITFELAQRVGHVIAVEIDAHWYQYLQEKLENLSNVTVYRQDFLEFTLPRLPYKVFANIPFAIEGKVVRKLLEDANPPYDCYLVVMKELAQRFCMGHTMFSAMHSPWFDFSIAHYFDRCDFTPMPNVDAVLLRIVQKSMLLLPWQERKRYMRFIQTAFCDGQAVRHNLKRIVSLEKIDHALHSMSLRRNIRPADLTQEQWRRLYEALYDFSGRSTD
ncbi:MAG: 23S ribosomal RNA methyltransferase Erm [Candidatus Pacebacteria bacterium]|nr:23S ribosomal RNA methyltransferase Erm [Candidatus Paceibacterota bacterium]